MFKHTGVMQAYASANFLNVQYKHMRVRRTLSVNVIPTLHKMEPDDVTKILIYARFF